MSEPAPPEAAAAAAAAAEPPPFSGPATPSANSMLSSRISWGSVGSSSWAPRILKTSTGLVVLAAAAAATAAGVLGLTPGWPDGVHQSRWIPRKINTSAPALDSAVTLHSSVQHSYVSVLQTI